MLGVFRLLLWCVLSYGLYAYDLSEPKRPLGRLGVTLDYSFATRWPDNINTEGPQAPRNWVYSSHITFNGKVDQIEGQLWKLVTDAYAEMIADKAQYHIRTQPTAIGFLAWDNHLILASTQRGDPSFSYNHLDTPVRDSLHICQLVWKENAPSGSDIEHKSGGKCVEQIAAQLYYIFQQSPLQQNLPLQQQSARVGTVVGSRTGGSMWGP
jgi:hypothetical protein